MGGKLQQLMARLTCSSSNSGDVPRGHFAVYVGEARRRFVIPTAYLKHPSFVALLKSVEEEFGFDHHSGGLTIPCNERDFVALLNKLSSSSSYH